MHYFRLYFKYLSLAIKSRLVYKVDAIIGIIGFLITNIFSLVVISLILAPINGLGGWSRDEIIFLYALTLIPKGIDHITTDALWSIGNGMVVKGELDRYLVTPINPLFQIVAENFQHEGLGELLLGICMLFIILPKVTVNWTIMNIIGLSICLFLSIFIYTGIKLFTASLAFWMKKSIQITSIAYTFSDFARYPLTIFNQVITFILTFIIPFALTAYYPIDALLHNKNIFYPVLYLLLMAPSFLFLAYRFWKFGLARYESAGN